MSTVTGQQIAVAGTQPPIGTFVQDATHPNGSTNYIGGNSEIVYTSNNPEPGIPIGTVLLQNHKTTQAQSGSIFCHSTAALAANERVNIIDGEATANVAGTHFAKVSVPADGYFWALLF